MKRNRIRIFALILTLLLIVTTSCTPELSDSNENTDSAADENVDSPTDINAEKEYGETAPVIEGLIYESAVALDYAKCFQIYRYEGGYSVICVDDGRNYLLVPEDGTIPESVPMEYIVIQKPLNNIYMASSSSMSLFDALDALDTIRLSATNADGWYVEHAKEAMEEGNILFAGKYSEPDYELLLEQKCTLAIENTMLLHTPEVQEKLEELGISVFIDRSSYEEHPLGRTEWIKVYGEFTDTTENAETFFEEQKAYITNLEKEENTGKTVAYFYMSRSGTVVTRKTSDYVPKMIELAGGNYIFDNLGSEETSASSSVNMTMEEFYASAKDADYIIYNGTIDNPLNSVEELIAKSELFEDFKAVQDGNVWCTGKNMFQATDAIGSIIGDFHTMLTDDSVEELTFMYRIH